MFGITVFVVLVKHYRTSS